MENQNEFIRKDEILPKGIYPVHLEEWANDIDKELGYVSTLATTLRELAKKIRNTRS